MQTTQPKINLELLKKALIGKYQLVADKYKKLYGETISTSSISRTLNEENENLNYFILAACIAVYEELQPERDAKEKVLNKLKLTTKKKS